MIELRDVKKRFGAIEAVRGVSFSAKNGEIVGVLGPNGAGKTTSLRIACALFPPDEGTAFVDNLDVSTAGAEVKRRIGVLTHAHGIYPRLTPREHVRYAGRLHGVPDEIIEARFAKLAELLDMKAFMDRRCDGFSQGQKLKTAIARALIHDPKNVILDEPTAGLDVKAVRGLRDVIRTLKIEGRCVLFSTHVMQEVSELCDKIVVIAGGRVTAEGAPGDLLLKARTVNLEDAFVQLAGEGLV